MEGLDITELSISDVLTENDKFRIDSGYFSKNAIRTERLIESLSCGFTTLGEISSCFRKGIFDIKADTYTETGVPFVRISNLRNGLIDDSEIVYISEEAHAAENKTALKFGDVVLSKTAYPAASFVNLPRCNVSQDTIAVRLSSAFQQKINTAYLTAFLNTRYGLVLLDRQFQGNVQMHLSLPDGEKIKIPLFSDALQNKIHECFIASFQESKESSTLQVTASNTLLRALDLENWTPPEPLTYSRRASEVFGAGRLDSQFFAPRVAMLIKQLSKDSQTIRGVAPPRQEKFVQFGDKAFRYIEISNLRSDGTVTYEMVPMSEAPSRATWYVRSGDVLTSTVRPIRRLTALIAPEQDGCVASSGFVVLQPKAVAPEVLLTYLRLPLFCELMDLHTSASLYPAISERDLLSLPFPNISQNASDKVVAAVRSAHMCLKHANELLEQAKRAVEIAIEDSEAAAIKYLKEI